jgi:hypothetical protein
MPVISAYVLSLKQAADATLFQPFTSDVEHDIEYDISRRHADPNTERGPWMQRQVQIQVGSPRPSFLLCSKLAISSVTHSETSGC